MRHPDWSRDGADWPNRASSRFVSAGGLRWHVQIAGTGPVVLLAHGTGASTHSWRDFAPLLGEHFTVVAPDLPGHAFTEAPSAARMSLPGMAAALHALVLTLGVSPALAIGHSAGAAVLARMALDGHLSARGLVSLNGALLPLHGLAGRLFSPAAKALAALPLVPQLFAWSINERGMLDGLVRSTGSTLDERGVALYGRLAGSPGHAAAALAMMAHWDLDALAADLPRLALPLLLIVGARDRTVPPADASRVAALVRDARVVTMPGLGHLSHEERPRETADLVVDFARSIGALAGA